MAGALYKIVLIGDSGVGKTQMLAAYSGQRALNEQGIDYQFEDNSKPTIGVELTATTFTSKLDNATVKVQLWDTAGQGRYQAITSSHYKRAVGAMIVFDVSNHESFQNALNNWLSALMNATKDNEIKPVVMLCGNKTDLDNHVSTNEHLARAREAGILLTARTSARTGEGIIDAFERLIEKVHQTQAKLRADESIFEDPSMREGGSPKRVSKPSSAEDGEAEPPAPGQGGCCTIS